MPRSTLGPRSVLEQLIQLLERRAGSSSITVQRPRRNDWQVTVFRDNPHIDQVVFHTGHGDTLADAVHDLLGTPSMAAA